MGLIHRRHPIEFPDDGNTRIAVRRHDDNPNAMPRGWFFWFAGRDAVVWEWRGLGDPVYPTAIPAEAWVRWPARPTTVIGSPQ